MKTLQMADGQWIIQGDEHIVEMAESVDHNAPYWEYAVTERIEGVRTTDPVTEITGTVRVDVSEEQPTLDVLSKLFLQAESTKRPEHAAAYVRHKARILALFENRDRNGNHVRSRVTME